MDKRARELAINALTHAPQTCQWHGVDFERAGMQWGEPRCESCRQPWRVVQALDALKPLPVGEFDRLVVR